MSRFADEPRGCGFTRSQGMGGFPCVQSWMEGGQCFRVQCRSSACALNILRAVPARSNAGRMQKGRMVALLAAAGFVGTEAETPGLSGPLSKPPPKHESLKSIQ